MNTILKIGENYQMLLGKLKTLEEITIQDFKETPIWINDLSGESKYGFDETSIRPYVGGRNITKAMLHEYLQVSALGLIGDELDCVVDFEHGGGIFNISIWMKGKWLEPKDVFDQQAIEVKIIPPIFGYQNQVYIYHLDTGESYNRDYPPLGL